MTRLQCAFQDVFEKDMVGAGNTWSVQQLLDGTLESEQLEKLKQYINPLSIYDGWITALPSDVRLAVIVAGSHWKDDFPRSTEYILGVRSLFMGKGFDVQLKLGQYPDNDIMYASQARFFFQAGGGFSRLIGGLVRSMGGRVWCSDDHHGTGNCGRGRV